MIIRRRYLWSFEQLDRAGIDESKMMSFTPEVLSAFHKAALYDEVKKESR